MDDPIAELRAAFTKYLADDAERWHAVHDRIEAHATAFRCLLAALVKRDAVDLDALTRFLLHAEQDARRNTLSAAYATELRSLRETIRPPNAGA